MGRRIQIAALLLFAAAAADVRPSFGQTIDGVEVRDAEPGSDESVRRVRSRIQQIRGGSQRVIYPIIIVADGDSAGYPLPSSQLPADRMPGYGPLSVSGQPAGGQLGVPDSIAVQRALAAGANPTVAGAANARLNADASNTAAANLALANEMALLRAELGRARMDAARSQADRDRAMAEMGARISDLERDVDLLLAAWVTPEGNRRDTLVVIRPDTLRQRIVVQPPRVDTVFIQTRPGPPTVVEIERALLDEGLFQTVDVLFEFNKSTLHDASLTVLASIGQVLRAHPEIRIQVGGHSDSVGPDVYNLTLSERRAQSVMDYLVSQEQVSADRISFRGYGETVPAASNTTATGRALNRRVEFRVLHDD